MKRYGKPVRDHILILLALSVLNIFLMMFGFVPGVLAGCLITLAVYAAFLIYKYRKGTLPEEYRTVAGIHMLIYALMCTVILILVKGNTEAALMAACGVPAFPFLPLLLLAPLMGQNAQLYGGIFLVLAGVWLINALLRKTRRSVYLAAVLAVCMGISGWQYMERPQRKYGGHGFDYMNGYSSTDFTGYHVYDGEKLAALDHAPPFVIENEADMPVLDGAEACYPVYCAVAKTLYQDIGAIETEYRKTDPNGWRYQNGKIVTFTNTVRGYDRLVRGEIDLLFGARPSRDQQEYAKEYGEEIVPVPIGKEAFVFFAEKDNPVESLTVEQIRAIYHGDITNWKEVGGKDQKILAFQRPQGSGSQTMMEAFMKDTGLKEPIGYEVVDPMAGVIRMVAQYHNEAGALGYTFRCFLEELGQEGDVRMIAVNGVYPTPETIRDGSYPVTVDLVCAVLASNDKPYVKKVLDFLVSEDGQELIGQTGYGRLPE